MSLLPVPMEVTSLNLSGVNLTFVAVVGVIALIALVMAMIFRREVLAAGDGTANMQSIARAVQEGASAYLGRQFRTLSVFAVAAFFLLLLLPVHASAEFSSLTLRIGRSVAFLVGAVFSALIGYLGMWLAVRANVRVAAAARDGGRDPAMRIAFRTGGIVGMLTVGLGLLGAALVVLHLPGRRPDRARGLRLRRRPARHVHAGRRRHLHQGRRRRRRPGRQGRAEHPRGRPAQRRDDRRQRRRQRRRLRRHGRRPVRVLRRDAGRRADPRHGGLRRRGPGLPADRPGHRRRSPRSSASSSPRPRPGENGLTTINRAFYISAASPPCSCAIAVVRLPARAASPSSLNVAGASAGADGDPRLVAIGAVVIGIVLAARHPGAHRLLHRHRAPPGQGRRQDLADRRGHRDPLRPLGRPRVGRLHRAGHRRRRLRRVPARRRLAHASSLFAVALAGSGLLTTVGVIVAMDTFGPVSDNAQGIAEMSGDVSTARAPRSSPSSTRSATPPRRSPRASRSPPPCSRRPRCSAPTPPRSFEALREANADRRRAHLLDFSVFNPAVLVGLLLGAAVVFLFSGLAINAVARAAGAVVFEVRRQFREIPGIMEGTGRPEYGKVVDICTRDSLRELATPGPAGRPGPDRRRLRPRRRRAGRLSSPARSAPAP